MLNSQVLGRYILKESLVHKLNPVFKILSLLIMIIAIFFIDSYIDVLMMASYLFLVIIYSDIKVSAYLKNIISIRFILMIILVIDLIFFKSINNIIFDLFRIIFIVLYSSILTLTTALTEINYGIFKLLKPFSKFIKVNDVALVITIALRYVPTFTTEVSRIASVQRQRGIDFKSGNIKEKIGFLLGVLTPAFTHSIRRSLDLGEMMELRLYNYGKSRTNYRLNNWRLRDSMLLILNLLILIIVIFY